jgi:hypothetical protein
MTNRMMASCRGHRKWIVAAAAVAVLAVAGCATDPEVARDEPSTEGAQEVTVPASAGTATSLGIASWRYQAVSEGVVVRGVAADGTVHTRFWIAAGETSDELIAHSADTSADAVIPREGGVRTSNAEFRDELTAFRADSEAAQASATKEKTQNVGDNVGFCLGNSGSFGTWAFWGVTNVQIENASSTWVKFSFQAGAGYEENWIQPWTATTFGRQWAAFPVRITYIDYSEGAPPCPVPVHVW